MDDAVPLPSPDELKLRLRKLWPHRSHESNWVKAAACRLHLHRWYRMTLNDATSAIRVSCAFCRFCEEVKVHRVERAGGSAD
jgi:hypothetical protein